MSKGEISHIGVVKEITSEKISVEIISESACGSCSAAGLCSAAEAKKKEIVVTAGPFDNYSVGEQVKVVLRQSMGLKAVLLAYVLPLIILMALVVSLSYTGIGELATGLIGICGVLLYFAILYFFRRRLAREYVFEIKKR